MPNRRLLERLEGIHAQLMAAHAVGTPLTNESKGTEREDFIDKFLSEVLPRVFRFATGDVIDGLNNASGQLDVVIEHPYGPSFPAVGGADVRLFLAETVAAVIEVKSNLSTQWEQVQRTATKIAPLTRQFATTITFQAGPPSREIPFYAVGFTGWSDPKILVERVNSTPALFGALDIEHRFFYSRAGVFTGCASGPAALGAFILTLERQVGSLQSASMNPGMYLV